MIDFMPKSKFKVGDRVKVLNTFGTVQSVVCDYKGAVGSTYFYYLKNLSKQDLVKSCYRISENILELAGDNKQPTPKKEYPPTITKHIFEGNKTIVHLSDGTVGEVSCYYQDTYDPAIGIAEAYKKSNISNT